MRKILFPASIVFITTISGLLGGCLKSNTKDHNPADSTSNPDHDILYMLSDAGLQKIEFGSGKADWTTAVNQGVGTFNCPLDYSMGNVYFGGLSDMASFNYEKGATNWENAMLYDPSVSIYNDYRGTAFHDSLVFYTRPTGVYNGPAELYCAYQDNGQILWTNQIDSNSGGLTDFNSIPVAVNGNVVTLTREYYGDFRITVIMR
jgi:outer membrane protein assembly factor BamB